MLTFIVIIAAYLGLHIGLYKIFQERSIEGWKAFVPFYSEYLWCKIVGRPASSVFWLWVPVVGFFVGANMLVDLARSYKKYGLGEHILMIVFPFIFVPLMAFSKKLEYRGEGYTLFNNWKDALQAAIKAKDKDAVERLQTRDNPFPRKSILREWVEAISFAVFAAHFIRLLFIEAYTIPTESMEGSLLVGDFLFVSKMSYGVRMPITPLSFPLLHNMFPRVGAECYTKAVQWGYRRLPIPFLSGSVQRYDPVVFNYPEGDTVFGGLKVQYHEQYYNRINYEKAKFSPKELAQLVVRPIDKRDHYIKRCVGLAGDVIEVKAGVLYVNGQIGEPIKGVQYRYQLFPKNTTKDIKSILEKTSQAHNSEFGDDGGGRLVGFMNQGALESLNQTGAFDSIVRQLEPAGERGQGIFPYNGDLYKWNIDNYGPLTIPKAGETVQITMSNIDLYKRVIATYEGNKLEFKDGQILINGAATNSYTFKQNYYWMMGDNRNRSADSRAWGFVPEDHIVGKPVFVFMSYNKTFRWDRLFMGANGR
jgi:signal peptidase I